MARLARVVVPGIAHHVTQRGNGRARTFFSDADYALYRDLLAAQCRRADAQTTARFAPQEAPEHQSLGHKHMVNIEPARCMSASVFPSLSPWLMYGIAALL